MMNIQRINPMTIGERVSRLVQQLSSGCPDDILLYLRSTVTQHAAQHELKALAKAWPADLSAAANSMIDESVLLVDMWLNAALVGLDPLDAMTYEEIIPTIQDLVEHSKEALRSLLTSGFWPKAVDPINFIDTFPPQEAYIGFAFIEAGASLSEDTRLQLGKTIRSSKASKFVESVQAIQDTPGTSIWPNFTQLTEIAPFIPEDVLKNKAAALRFVEAMSALTDDQSKILTAFAPEAHERLAMFLKGLACKRPGSP